MLQSEVAWPKFLPKKSATQKCLGFKKVTMHGRRAGSSSYFPFIYVPKAKGDLRASIMCHIAGKANNALRVACSLRRRPKFLPKSATQKCLGFKKVTMQGQRTGSSHFPSLYMSQRRPHSLNHVSHCREGQQRTACCLQSEAA